MKVYLVLLSAVLAGCVSAQSRMAKDIEVEKAACRSQNFSKKVPLARCINAAEAKAASVYPADLLQLRLASRMVIAEKQDKGQLTDAEAELEYAKVGAQIGSQEATRNSNDAMAAAAYQMTRPRTCVRIGNGINCF